MNSIFSKLKTSATLWSVIGGFILAIANIVWGEDSAANSISSAIMFAIPAASYIVSKFILRMKLADVNNDGEISVQEFANVLNSVINETSKEGQEVIDAFGKIIITLAGQVEDESALTGHGETIHDEEGE